MAALSLVRSSTEVTAFRDVSKYGSGALTIAYTLNPKA